MEKKKRKHEKWQVIERHEPQPLQQIPLPVINLYALLYVIYKCNENEKNKSKTNSSSSQGRSHIVNNAGMCPHLIFIANIMYFKCHI